MSRQPLWLVSSDRAAVRSVWDVPDQEPVESEDAYLARLGRTIARIRKNLLDLDQQALAERVGVEKNTISRWENGRTALSAHSLSKIWAALGVPGDWLLDPTDSVTELDRRIEQLRRVASEAAALEAAAAPRRPSGGGRGPRPGRRSA